MLTELAELGVARARSGSGPAWRSAMSSASARSPFVAAGARRRRDQPRARGAARRRSPTPALTAALAAAARGAGPQRTVASADVIRDRRKRRPRGPARRWLADGAVAPRCRPRPSSPLGRSLGVGIAALLVVVATAPTATGGDAEALERAASAAGALGARGRSAMSGAGLGLRRLERCADASVAGDVVDAVLDRLDALRDRAQAALEALDVGGRGKVQRAHRRALRLTSPSRPRRARSRGPG